jgi:quercetin dioxygenase-like cupin family protein
MHAAAALDPTLVRHYGDEAGCHAHEHAQVLCGLDGTLQLEVNGHAAFVDAACGLVVPPGALHAYRAERPARVLVLDCAPHSAGRPSVRQPGGSAKRRKRSVPHR